MTLILRILFNALGLILIAELFSGIEVNGVYTAIVAAIVLGLLNAIVRPVLLLLTLPITILTLGLFALVINGLLFMFAASFIQDFSVTNFWYALLGSLAMSVVSTLGSKFINAQPARPAHDRVQYREIRD